MIQIADEGTESMGLSCYGGLNSKDGRLYFAGEDPNGFNTAWWWSDGTVEGSSYCTPEWGGVSDVTGADGHIYYLGYYDQLCEYLWEGNTAVATFGYGTYTQHLSHLTSVDGKVYFIVEETSDSDVFQLWKGDWSGAGEVRQITDPGGLSSGAIQWLADVDGTLYFSADDGVNGTELWTSDGTEAGTVLVKDINPGSGGSNPSPVVKMNGALYFTADDGTNGRATWAIRPPVAVAGDYDVDEGGSVQLDGSASSDSGETLTYAWDLDNNGSYETPGMTPTFSAADIDGLATRTVGLKVTNSAGLFSTAAGTITIHNVAPTAAITADQSNVYEEGSPLHFTANVADPGVNDTFAYAWSVTKDGVAVPLPEETTHGDSFAFTPAASGEYTISLSTSDNDGAPASTSETFCVAVVPPTNVNVSPVSTVEVAVSWIGNSNSAIGYEVQLWANDCWTTVAVAGPSQTSANVTGLLMGTSYSFRVIAKGSNTTQDSPSQGPCLGRTRSDKPATEIIGDTDSAIPGQLLSLSVLVTDEGNGGPVQLSWFVIDVQSNVIATGTNTDITFTPSASGTYTIAVVSTDNLGSSNIQELSIEVAPVSLTLQGASQVYEGEEFVLTLPAGATSEYASSTWLVDWGDYSDAATGDTSTASLTHSYGYGGTAVTIDAQLLNAAGEVIGEGSLDVQVRMATPTLLSGLRYRDCNSVRWSSPAKPLGSYQMQWSEDGSSFHDISAYLTCQQHVAGDDVISFNVSYGPESIVVRMREKNGAFYGDWSNTLVLTAPSTPYGGMLNSVLEPGGVRYNDLSHWYAGTGPMASSYGGGFGAELAGLSYWTACSSLWWYTFPLDSVIRSGPNGTTRIADPASGDPFLLDAGLAQDSIYTYEIMQYGTGNVLATYFVHTPLDVVENVTAVASLNGASVHLSWNALIGAAGYIIGWGRTNIWPSSFQCLDGATTSCDIPVSALSFPMEFSVAAVAADGMASYAGASTAIQSSPLAFALTVTASGNSANTMTVNTAASAELFIGGNDSGQAAIDLSVTPVTADCAVPIRWEVRRSDDFVIAMGSFASGPTISDLGLWTTEGASDFQVTAWRDANDDGEYDAGEPTRTIDVQVVKVDFVFVDSNGSDELDPSQWPVADDADPNDDNYDIPMVAVELDLPLEVDPATVTVTFTSNSPLHLWKTNASSRSSSDLLSLDTPYTVAELTDSTSSQPIILWVASKTASSAINDQWLQATVDIQTSSSLSISSSSALTAEQVTGSSSDTANDSIVITKRLKLTTVEWVTIGTGQNITDAIKASATATTGDTTLDGLVTCIANAKPNKLIQTLVIVAHGDSGLMQLTDVCPLPLPPDPQDPNNLPNLDPGTGQTTVIQHPATATLFGQKLKVQVKFAPKARIVLNVCHLGSGTIPQAIANATGLPVWAPIGAVNSADLMDPTSEAINIMLTQYNVFLPQP